MWDSHSHGFQSCDKPMERNRLSHMIFETHGRPGCYRVDTKNEVINFF